MVGIEHAQVVWKKCSAEITHGVVTLVSVDSHALQTNQQMNDAMNQTMDTVH